MSWRPDGWKNPYDGLKLINAPENLYGKGKFVCTGLRKKQGKEDFEAGADAILEALRKNGTHEPEINLEGKQISTAEGHCFPYRPAGTYVFIPYERE